MDIDRHQALPARRVILLALSLLSGCAAAEPGQEPSSAARRAASPVAASDAGAFLAGRAAGEQGDLDVAAEAFLDVLATDPGNVEVQQQAFLACLLVGRPEAIGLAQAQPGNPIAQMLLGDRDAKRGEWAAAERRFAALPTQGMTQILQPLLLAWAQAGSGRTDQALATLRPLMTGDRFRSVYVFHAALIADLGQRDPEAGRLYAAARAAFPTPNLAVTRAEASWMARHGDAEGARRMLEALVASSPDFAIVLPGLTRHVADPVVRTATAGMAEAYVALAASLQGQDAAEPAALLLRLALDLRPELSGAKLLAAEVDEQAHRTQIALATLQSVGADDPLAPLADLRRAGLLQRVGRSDEALAVLGRLAAAAPDRPEPWLMRGAVLRGAHRYAEAIAAYNEGIDRVKQPTRENWVIFFERGIALERAGRWPEAEADFNHALALEPDEPSVLNYLGYSWAEQGQNLARAHQMIERAATLRPNDGAILDSLGWVMLRQGDVPGAVRNLERAVELEPEDATINGHLGDAYMAAGRKLEATFQWRRALTLNPDPDESIRIAGRLREAGDSTPLVGERATGKAQP